MEKFKTLADAIALAEYAHRNQTDKAELPYIDHPKRVLATVQAQSMAPYVQIASVLHDVPEDTAFSHGILLELGFSPAVVVLTRLLDRGHSERLFLGDYPQYRELDRHGKEYKKLRDNYYYNGIKNHGRDAVVPKLADIKDNRSGWRLAYLPGDEQRRLVEKYDYALGILNPAPVNHGMITDYVHDPFTLR